MRSQMTPVTLNTVWAIAALLADTFPTAAAMFAVIVVPIFSPSTIAAAISKGIHPKLTITRVRAMVALDDCRTIVRAVPIRTKMSTEPKPKSVHFWMNASASGWLPRSGTESFRAARPINSRAKPIMNSPMLLRLLFLDMKKTKPTAMRGIARIEMSAENPSRDISQAVTVVPILAPIITPIAFVSDRSPAFTKLTTITVVALDDWIMAVISKPVSTLLKALDVIEARKALSLSPAAF